MHTQKCNLFSMNAEGPPGPGIAASMCDCAASVYSHGLPWAIIVRADSSPDNGHGSVLLDPIGILLGSLHQTSFIMHCTDHRYR
jgi:hypothetical protein